MNWKKFDDHPMRSGKQLRFCCPICGASKPRGDRWRSLSLNRESGLYYCHRCHGKGIIEEKQASGEFISKPAKKRATLNRVFNLNSLPRQPKQSSSGNIVGEVYSEAVRLSGTTGGNYVQSRGIRLDLAEKAGVLFHPRFYGREAVIFPIRNQSGELAAINGRFVDGKDLTAGEIKTQTAGSKKLGVFATPGVWDAQTVVICEAGFDALSLHQCCFPAIALIGTSGPDWLSSALAFRNVFVGTDADAAGDEAAERLISSLKSRGARAVRLRPSGGKDWSELLEKYGREFLESFLIEKHNDAFTHLKLLRRFESNPAPPLNCPLCTIELKEEKRAILIIRFCPLGCDFASVAFINDEKAVLDSISVMFDSMTHEELEALTDALDERASILISNYDIDWKTAASAAEKDILPRYFFEYSLPVDWLN